MAIEHSSWSAELPQRMAAKVAAELGKDETIVWLGQPGRKLVLPSSVSVKIVIYAILAIIATVAAVMTGGVPRVILWIVAGLLWLIVTAGIMLPELWRIGIVQRNYYYMLTNRRVLICYRIPTRFRIEVRTYTPAQLVGMRCEERDDGSGDLRFDADGDKPPSLREGFIMIDRVREVEELMRQTLDLRLPEDAR